MYIIVEMDDDMLISFENKQFSTLTASPRTCTASLPEATPGRHGMEKGCVSGPSRLISQQIPTL